MRLWMVINDIEWEGAVSSKERFAEEYVLAKQVLVYSTEDIIRYC